MEYFEGREEEMNLENPVPVGYIVFAVIMVVAMLYYMYAYTPMAGWTEASEYEKAVANAHHASAEPAKAETTSNETK